jgi:glycosyltransferase involved in cell wall biosynthesis
MHLLLVIDGLHTRDGGPPRVVVDSAIALARLGHTVTIASTLRSADADVVRAMVRPAEEVGVVCIFVDRPAPWAIWSPSHGGELFAAISEADVVHCHGVWSPLLLTAGRLAEQLGTPYFVSSHGLFSPWAVRKSRLKKQFATLIFGVGRYCDHAAAVIFGTKGEYEVSAIPGRSPRAVFVPNGAAIGKENEQVTDADEARLFSAVPEVKQWRRTVLFFSRIHPKKGLDMLVDAFAQVAPQFPGTGLLIAGLAEDANYQWAVERQIANARPAPIVMTTALVGDGSRFLYSFASVFALPSHDEGFSIALLEALASGCPSLCTTFCHLPEIAEEHAGVVVAPTADAIALGLMQLLSQDDHSLAAMGARASALFQARFSWESVARQLSACYATAMPK